ncbi:GNAT family N-acetyltransferase [Bifidobacterium angulatum]
MQADEVYIRRLRRADYPALVELIRQTWYADQTDGDTGGHEPADRARRHSVAWRLAAIDAHDCLARTTYAAVVERNGRIIGVILGSVPAKVTRMQILRHRWQQASLALPMLANRAGRNGLREQLAILHADRALIQTTGNDYQAEIVLFLVSPEAKGQGVGGRLFAHMLDRFHALGIRQYFLFTDTTCDYGFYEHKGLQRAGVRNLALAHGEQLQCFLYQGRVNDKER